MALDSIIVGLSIMVLTLQMFALFLILEIRSRVEGKLGDVFLLGIMIILILIALRVQSILSVVGLLSVPYLQEILSTLLSLFIFLAVYNMYGAVKEATDRPAKRSLAKKRSSFSNGREIRRNIAGIKTQSGKTQGYLDLTKT